MKPPFQPTSYKKQMHVMIKTDAQMIETNAQMIEADV